MRHRRWRRGSVELVEELLPEELPSPELKATPKTTPMRCQYRNFSAFSIVYHG
jgi:hypothetical protein